MGCPFRHAVDTVLVGRLKHGVDQAVVCTTARKAPGPRQLCRLRSGRSLRLTFAQAAGPRTWAPTPAGTELEISFADPRGIRPNWARRGWKYFEGRAASCGYALAALQDPASAFNAKLSVI